MSAPVILFIPITPDHEDGTVLCAIVDVDDGPIRATVNTRYPHAEEHVRAHVERGFNAVLICRPDCDGTQR